MSKSDGNAQKMARDKFVMPQNKSILPDEAEPSLPMLRIAVLGLFLIGLIFAGGASRFDAAQITILRPLAALLLIPTGLLLAPSGLRRAPVLIALLGFWLLWMIIQLIPLPYGIWQELPERDIVRNIDAIAGFEGMNRPISFTPFRGWNAVFSMVVPFCALLMAISFKLGSRQLLLIVAAIGLADSGVGLLQVVSGPQSPFYLYAITNHGLPVGIFANENHSAVFSALVLLVIARLAFTGAAAGDPRWLKLAYIPSSIIILLTVLISASRAGLALSLLALVFCGAMAWFEGQEKPAKEDAHSQSRGKLPQILVFVTMGIPFIIFGIFLGMERTPAFEDILARDSFEDLRWSLWPLLKDMMQTHWLVGTGFGSFDNVYQIYEPSALLMRAYVNQAHNDWAQIVIEGGLPAILILTAAIVWLASAVWSIWKGGRELRGRVVFWIGCFAIICLASLVDYPLRTPIFQSSMIWLLIVLTDDKSRWQ